MADALVTRKSYQYLDRKRGIGPYTVFLTAEEATDLRRDGASVRPILMADGKRGINVSA